MHFDEVGLDERRFRCAAFPGGVPEEIRRGTVRHVKPFPGDGGIQYQPFPLPEA